MTHDNPALNAYPNNHSRAALNASTWGKHTVNEENLVETKTMEALIGELKNYSHMQTTATLALIDHIQALETRIAELEARDKPNAEEHHIVKLCADMQSVKSTVLGQTHQIAALQREVERNKAPKGTRRFNIWPWREEE